MATKAPKAPKAQAPAAPAAQAPAAPAAQAPAAPAAQAPAAQAPAAQAPAAPAAQAPAPVVIAGNQVTLTKSQIALQNAKHGGRVMPGQAGVAYTLGGKPYKVRTSTNAAQWAAVLAAMQANGGTATVPQVVAAGCPLTLAAPFVAYAVNRGWLAPVAA
jgi:hypothetical protein